MLFYWLSRLKLEKHHLIISMMKISISFCDIDINNIPILTISILSIYFCDIDIIDILLQYRYYGYSTFAILRLSIYLFLRYRYYRYTYLYNINIIGIPIFAISISSISYNFFHIIYFITFTDISTTKPVGICSIKSIDLRYQTFDIASASHQLVSSR